MKRTGGVAQRARSLLAAHQPTPLPDGVLAELADLERAWWARLGEGQRTSRDFARRYDITRMDAVSNLPNVTALP